jgi:hypothetical protein
MQILARTSSAGTAYTADQVRAQLSAPAVQERWVFDRLNASGVPIGDLTPYVDYSATPEIDHDSTRSVRRTLKMRVAGNSPLTPLHDLIRPRYQILMPDGGWVDFVLGTFAILPTNRQIEAGATWLDIQGADLSQLLVDAGFLVSTGIPGGTGVIAGVNMLVSGYGGLTPITTRIVDPGTVLPAAYGWEYGNNPLKAVNDLLAAVNFTSAALDENGVLCAQLIPDWNQVIPSATFDTTTSTSMVLGPINERPDYSKAFNVAIVVIEDPRRPSLSATVPNWRSDSPIAIPNWHVKTQVIRDSRVVDLVTAEAVGLAAIQEAARIYSPVILDTLPWPAWQDQDVCRLVYSSPDEGTVNVNCVVSRWTHRCRAGAKTTHTLHKIVPAGPA